MDALGRRALVAVARLRHLDEHLVRDDVRRRRVDAVLRRVRVGQEEALDLGERDRHLRKINQSTPSSRRNYGAPEA